MAPDQRRVLWWNVSRTILSVDLYYLSTDCSHVAKTGDIKDFVITEESGIAKGIRRIVAVTGHEAHEVTRVAHSLSEKLSTIEGSAGKAKDAALKAMTVVRFYHAFFFFFTWIKLYLSQELNQADISVLKKAELRDRLATIRKAFDKDIKDREILANRTVGIPLVMGRCKVD